jgi:hypothetical protein
MVFCASHSRIPLSVIETTAKAIHEILFDVVCDSLSPSGQPISHKPATIKYIQGIFPPEDDFLFFILYLINALIAQRL